MLRFVTYIVSLLALLAAAPAGAADRQVVPRPAQAPCGEYCQLYKSAHPTTPKPTSVPLACINIKQARTDNVVLTFYRGDRSVLREIAKTVPARGRFCFNRAMLEQAAAIMLCNGPNTSVIEGRWMVQLRQQGGMTPTQYSCLIGKECKNYRGERPKWATVR